MDLLHVLPQFDSRPFSHLLPSLDKACITVNDLLTLEPTDVAKRATLPAADLRKLVDALALGLHKDLGFGAEELRRTGFLSALGTARARDNGRRSISTLDEKLDEALGGGVPSGYLVEVTGESGAGKTQLLLTLLLASQLPPPHGLSQAAVYISTEAALATTRLTQLVSSHPILAALAPNERPSLSRILSIQTPDLESQDHIIRYQLPVAIKKHNVGLVVLDSVAANYRAEFEKTGPRTGAASMAKRGAQLVQLGALLRDLARTEGIAIVVANQVADRFTREPPSNAISRTTSAHSQNGDPHGTPHAAVASQTHHLPSQPDGLVISPDPLTLDHQQRWFTGWGDSRSDSDQSLKTPSLGLVWTNQLAGRIALIKQPVYANRPLAVTIAGENEWHEEENHISRWRRWFKLVFASWAAPSEGKGVEFEVVKGGIRHAQKDS